MDSFTTRQAAPANAACDPTKRVNYSFGMVLSVDDFVQEQSYHIGRAEWMARDLFGYGTVSGLAVSVGKNGQNEMEVNVTAGAAVSPRGQMIRVAPAQCANLSKWLAVEQNRQGVRDRVGEPPTGPVSLYVVLCYRDCPTDKVPIPGEPCRSEDDAVAASRLTDDFKLELRFAPPSQLEEDALRDFVQWLEMNLEITDEPGAFTDLATLRTNLLQAAAPVTSPPTSPPDFMLDSPPAPMRIHTSDACAFLREAFRLWVTELRPRWRPASFGAGCCGDQVDEQGHEEEECVLLAELVVPLTVESLIDDVQAIAVQEERRPFVLHLRMLQEWLLCGKFGQIVASVSSPPDMPPPPPPLALDDLIDVDAPSPQENQVLMFQSEAGWIAGTLPAAGATGPAGGDLTGDYPDPEVVRLRGRSLSPNNPNPGQVLTFDGVQWTPADVPVSSPPPPPPAENVIHPGDAAGGDLADAYPNPTVVQLQKRALSNAQPSDGDVLTWDQTGQQWRPNPVPAAPAPARQPVINLLPFATIVLGAAPLTVSIVTFRVWFNLDAPRNRVAITSLPNTAISLQAEDLNQPAFLTALQVTAVTPVQGARNLFDVQTTRQLPLLRFTFDLASIKVQIAGRDLTLLDYATENGINFAGFDGRRQVTVFGPLTAARIG
jgi:hypothetical protein